MRPAVTAHIRCTSRFRVTLRFFEPVGKLQEFGVDLNRHLFECRPKCREAAFLGCGQRLAGGARLLLRSLGCGRRHFGTDAVAEASSCSISDELFPRCDPRVLSEPQELAE